MLGTLEGISQEVTSANAAPSTRLMSGPIPTMTNSSRADRASRVDSVTPPIANRVTATTGTSRSRLVIMCPSSWARMLANSSRATATAAPVTSAGGLAESTWEKRP